MEDTFGMIFTRITHINFEEITEFMNTTNYTIEQYNVLKEKVKLAKDSINGYKRSCTDDSKILLVICNAAEDIINTLDDYLCSQESCIVKHEENCKQIKTGLGMTAISQETIDHIPCIKAFNDVKMDNLLYKYHKSLLTLANDKVIPCGNFNSFKILSYTHMLIGQSYPFIADIIRSY